MSGVYLPTSGIVSPLPEVPDFALDPAGATAELHPDLEPFLAEGPLGPMISHPLVVELIALPQMYSRINAYYAMTRHQIEKALAEQKWSQAVFLHERPWRAEALEVLSERITDDTQWWELVSSVWSDTENVWQCTDLWDRILDTSRPGHEAMMDAEERTQFAALPETLRVYRGIDADQGTRYGRSWTLDRDKAVWFATRFAPECSLLLTATVERSDIIALLLGRGESEVLVNPADLTEVTETLL